MILIIPSHNYYYCSIEQATNSALVGIHPETEPCTPIKLFSIGKSFYVSKVSFNMLIYLDNTNSVNKAVFVLSSS